MRSLPIKTCVLSALFVLLTSIIYAQTNGAFIPASGFMYVPSHTSLGIWGDTLGLKGSLLMADSTSVIYFKGKVWRNDTTGTLSGGKVVMNDIALQGIIGMGSYGNGPAFNRLEIDNPAGVYLKGSHARIDSQLIFSHGILVTGTNDVILGPAATTSQTVSSFASVDQGGAVSKFFGSNVSFTFPVGSSYNAITYDPLNLNVKASLYNPGSYVRVNITDSVHKKRSPRHVDYAKKLWSVQFRNLTVDSALYQASYGTADQFHGDTSKVVGSSWSNGKWSYASSAALASGIVGISGKITSDADIFGQSMVLQANVKAILQGAWNGSSMNTTLRTNNLVPLAQPYGAAPYIGANFNYAGPENRDNLPANIVDWVLVELRSTPTGPAVARSVGLIQNDGNIIDGFLDGPLEFSGIDSGSYYIVVKHRNHLGAMSAVSVTLPNAIAYDFTSGKTQAYGTTNQMATLSGGKFGLWGGNVNLDNSIRATGSAPVSDYQKILSTLGPSITVLPNIYSPADVNMNGNVRATGSALVSDYQILISYMGTFTLINQSF